MGIVNPATISAGYEFGKSIFGRKRRCNRANRILYHYDGATRGNVQFDKATGLMIVGDKQIQQFVDNKVGYQRESCWEFHHYVDDQPRHFGKSFSGVITQAGGAVTGYKTRGREGMQFAGVKGQGKFYDANHPAVVSQTRSKFNIPTPPGGMDTTLVTGTVDTTKKTAGFALSGPVLLLGLAFLLFMKK